MRHFVNKTSLSPAAMSRVDEREIAGASESIDDAPDLIELRKSKRARVPKRQWEQAEASKPRKKRRLTQLPTPTSTQTASQIFLFTTNIDKLQDRRHQRSIPQIQSKRMILETLRKIRSYLRGIGNTYNSEETQKPRQGTILLR
jgi:hypothetical protein